MFNTDFAFVIGGEHRINQDYVLTNNRNTDGTIVDEPFVILSDGCSSAPKADFGSRLLAAAAMANITKNIDLATFYSSTIANAQIFCRTIGLPPECLSATLLTAKVEGDVVAVNAYGDGVVAVMEESGAMWVYEIVFLSGAPYYLKYDLEHGDKELYFNCFGDDFEIRRTQIFPDGTMETSKDSGKINREKSAEFKIYPKLDEIKFVALMSDGVGSFRHQINTGTSVSFESVPVIDVVKELTSFKNFQGEFVQRRFLRAFEKFKKNNWNHSDDVSMGVLAKC